MLVEWLANEGCKTVEATCSITYAVSLCTPPACRRNSNYLPTPLRVYQHTNLSVWLPLSLTDLSTYTYLLNHTVMILHARMLIIEVNSPAADSLHIYSDFTLFGGWSSTNGYKWHGGRNAESGPDMSTSQKTLAGDHLSGLHNTCDHVHECTQDPNICQKTMLYLQLLGSVRLLGIGRRKFNTRVHAQYWEEAAFKLARSCKDQSFEDNFGQDVATALGWEVRRCVCFFNGCRTLPCYTLPPTISLRPFLWNCVSRRGMYMKTWQPCDSQDGGHAAKRVQISSCARGCPALKSCG